MILPISQVKTSRLPNIKYLAQDATAITFAEVDFFSGYFSFLKDRAQAGEEQRERERERERESEAGYTLSAQSLTQGSNS